MPETRRRRERGKHDGRKPVLGHESGLVGPSLPRPHSLLRPQSWPPLPSSAHGLAELDPVFWTTVDDGLATLQLELNVGARAAIDVHARLLREWNAHINLTALRDQQQIAIGHVLDSVAALPVLRRLPAHGSLLDMGSGGGFPGVPLAAALPAVQCALVDSIAKKARFLTVVAAAVTTAMTTAGQPAPAFQVFAKRAEDLATDSRQRQQWDCVVARAVGSLAEVIELGLPLLNVGGSLIAWKRDASDGALQRELDAARGALRLTGGRLDEIVPLPANLGAALRDHVLVVVHKERSTPDRFPRPPAERRRAALP